MVGGNLKSLEMFTIDFHRPSKKPNNTLHANKVCLVMAGCLGTFELVCA